MRRGGPGGQPRLPARGVLALLLCARAARTAAGLAPGDFRAPPFLDCAEEAGFSPLWTQFRRRAAWSAEQGWPLDPGLALLAARLLEDFDDVSTGRSWTHPAGTVWESFRTAEGRPEAPMLPPDIQIMPLAGKKDGNVIVESALGRTRGHQCLYGLVTALFVAYRHAVPRGAEDAQRHLEMILWLLGETEGGEQLFDFLESSAWPVRSIDVEANLEVAAAAPPARFVLLAALRSLPSGGGAAPPGPSPPQHAAPPPAIREPERSAGVLKLAVFGVHGATSLEPASALSSAWEESHGQGSVARMFFGHPCPQYALTGYLCEWKKAMFPAEELSSNDPVSDMLAEMVNFEHVEQAWDVHQALARLDAAYASSAFLRAADAWLCSGPAVLCALLRALAPQKPMLAWHCRHLLDGMGALPNGTQSLVLAALRAMAGRGGNSALVACEGFAAAQAGHQLGLPAPPALRRLALYARGFAWRGLAPRGRSGEVLVLRSMLWARLPGLYFKAVLEAFLQRNRDVFALRFRFANDAHVGFLSYEEIASHRCAVLVPNDLTMAAFAEAYAMGMPLFLPSDRWLYRLQKSVPYGFMLSAGRLPLRCRGCAEDGRPPPFWAERRRALTPVLHWLGDSDFATWPHTQRFNSVPELLHGLLSADLPALSAAMRSWASSGREALLPRWRWLLAALLEGRAEAPGEAPQEAAAPARSVPAADALYAGLACEHASFDAAGWPSFRLLVERNAEQGFPASEEAQQASAAVILALPELSEEQILLWNLALADFARLAAEGDAGAVPRLGGHCHLGVASALLLQARAELAGRHESSLVAHLADLASRMLQPLSGLAVPVGAWPLEDLMSTVSTLMAAHGGVQPAVVPR